MQSQGIRLSLLIAAFSAAACTSPLDTTRQSAPDQSFGEIVYTLSCQRLAYGESLAASSAGDADTVDVSGSTYRSVCHSGDVDDLPDGAYPSVEALNGERPGLIPAVDSAFPAGDLDDLQSLLTADDFLTVYDDGTADTAIDRLAAFLDLMGDDTDFAGALARLDWNPGYRPQAAAGGAMAASAAFPQMDALLLAVPDALAPGGVLHDDFAKLEAVLVKELEEAQSLASNRGAPDRALNLAGNLLLTESTLLGTSRPRYLARRDARGLALVQLDGATLPAPFVDKNNDGLADADVTGKFVDATGKPIAVPSPFATDLADPPGTHRDSYGRAMNAHGKPLYAYVDLDKTVLGAVARDTVGLVAPQETTALDLVQGARAVLGKRVQLTRTYPDSSTLVYSSFDAPSASFLDMVYGYLGVLADANVDDTLALVRKLVVEHEAQAAQLLEAMLAAADLGKDYPDAVLAPGSALYDDLIPVVEQILATPGLAEDLLRSLEDPQVKQLAKRFADLMTYKDSIDYNPDTQEVVGTMHTPVDRTKSDDGLNRSLFQRILHLINDSAGWKLCDKQDAELTFGGITLPFPTFDECALLEIDDLAVFYVQSIAYAKDANGIVMLDDKGRPLPKALLPLTLPSWVPDWAASLINDDVLESQSGIIGFRHHPTPEALNRVLFLDPAPQFIAGTMDPPLCKDGDRYIDAHSGSLAAFELNGTYDELRPLVQVFADHNAEALFVKVLVVLHSHWPSRGSVQHQHTDPNGYGYAKASDIHAWEPLIAQVLNTSGLWEALTSGAPVLDAINLPSGKNAANILTSAARFIFTPRAGLANRAGKTTTVTEDGRTVSQLSPWYILADAYKAKRAQIAASAADGKLWQDGGSLVLDVLARGDLVSGAWRFRNTRFRGESAALIDFLTARLDAHRAAGDLATWLQKTLVGDISDIVTSPVFAAAADFIPTLTKAPEARAALLQLLGYLNDDGGAGFDPAITVAGDLLQWFADDPDLVPVLHLAGKALDTKLGLVDAQLTFVQRARHSDLTKTVAKLLAHLDTAPASGAGDGRSPVATIIDTISEVHRVHPWNDLGKPMTAADYQQVWKRVAAYLNDQERGLQKFVSIVADRHLP